MSYVIVRNKDGATQSLTRVKVLWAYDY